MDKHLLKVKSITAQQKSDCLNLGSLELKLSNGESFKHSQGELDPDRRYNMDLENFKIDEIQIQSYKHLSGAHGWKFIQRGMVS